MLKRLAVRLVGKYSEGAQRLVKVVVKVIHGNGD